MNEKLRILMQNENLTASRLAEILEVKPAAISHILSGRNKPSFELLCKIVNRFPQINPYWLLGDAEEMRNANIPISTSESQVASSGTLFDLSEGAASKSDNSNIAPDVPTLSTAQLGRSDIEKIIIVYRDQTFEELRPKR
ncbi:MAG: helix-turn-helix transcriptional regulator [Rikenellaceae bacterium]|nr:helix-turn-helix transcriptional regulator [Rikenellaceae bacterium]